MKKIDARNLPCPQPVVLTKKALEEIVSGTIEVVVDNWPASENISRFAKNSGCKVKVREDGKDFVVEVIKGAESALKPETKTKGIVAVIASNTIGRGSDELGGILMKALLPILTELDPKPEKMVFMNNGVKLTVEGSPLLESLAKLKEKGVEILVCGTCLDYFKMKGKVRVGRISNLFEITEILLKAGKVISV